jgi:hypothetical protein
MAPPTSATEAERAIAALHVRFREGNAAWRLGCDVSRTCEANWRAELDDALLSALRGLEALGALPDGVAARAAEPWAAAEASLALVKAGMAAAGVPPPRASSHACTPGYDCAGCKQVRAPRYALRESPGVELRPRQPRSFTPRVRAREKTKDKRPCLLEPHLTWRLGALGLPPAAPLRARGAHAYVTRVARAQ